MSGAMEKVQSKTWLRYRNAFIAVKAVELDNVLAALDGASIAGRPIRAAPSRGGPGDRDGEEAEGDDAVCKFPRVSETERRLCLSSSHAWSVM